MNILEKALVTVVACDVVFCAVSLPLLLRRVPPNRVYGFRTPTTLRDPDIWYPANAHFGLRLIVASVCSAALFGVLAWRASLPQDLVLPVSVAALGLPVLMAGVSTSRLVNRISGGSLGR